MSKENAPIVTDQHAEIVLKAIDQKRKFDGWMNIITGMGQANRDARASDQVWRRIMGEVELENMYAGDSMASKIVDLIVDTAFEKGYCWTGISDADIKKLTQRLKELRFDHAVKEAAKKARLYGGACILKSYDDNLILNLPKNMNQAVPIKALVVLQRFELFSYWEDVNKDILSPDFGEPLLYTFVGRNGETMGMSNVKIHKSRLERFDGAWLPDKIRRANQYWHDSVLSRLYDAIRNYAHAHDSLNAAIKDLSVAVFKIKNLADQVAADSDKKVVDRLQLVNLCKSILRAVVVDADGEEFDYKARNLSGVEKLVEKAEHRLVAEVGYPHSVFFGESAAGGGLANNGDHNSENWYNIVCNYQENELKPKMISLAREVCDELQIEHSKLDIDFKPLWQMSEKEIVEMRKSQSEVDSKYVEMGVLDITEIRESRFGGPKYSIETKIDPSLDKVLEEESQLAREMQKEGMNNLKSGENPSEKDKNQNPNMEEK